MAPVQTTEVKPFFISRTPREKARVILAGAPLDVTGSFRGGTKYAPQAVRDISWTLEEYSILEKRSIGEAAFFDAGDIFFTGDLGHNLDEIEAFVEATRGEGRKPLLIGGEHLISYPAVRGLAKTHPDLCFLVFDAHTDLGDPDRQMSVSHATTTRLVFDLLGKGRVFQFGCRSGLEEDLPFIEQNFVFGREAPADEVLERLAGKPVYVSVDIDVLDPSEAPGVTTPELLGWSFRTLSDLLDRMSILKNVVGADVVEICPPFDPAGVTALVGATVLRKLIFLMDRP
jgi:agmatinase